MYTGRGWSGAHTHTKIRAQKYFPDLLKIVQKVENVQKIGSWPKNQMVGRAKVWVAQEINIGQISTHHTTHEYARKTIEKYSPELLKVV